MKRKESNMICFEKVLEIHLLIEIFKVFQVLKIFFQVLLEQDRLELLHKVGDLVLI
jgi:hypothetical protein